jgi:hypothetical protein
VVLIIFLTLGSLPHCAQWCEYRSAALMAVECGGLCVVTEVAGW